MTKKQEKLNISLNKEDEAQIILLRNVLEKKYAKRFSLADVVRHCTKQCVIIQDQI